MKGEKLTKKAKKGFFFYLRCFLTDFLWNFKKFAGSKRQSRYATKDKRSRLIPVAKVVKRCPRILEKNVLKSMPKKERGKSKNTDTSAFFAVGFTYFLKRSGHFFKRKEKLQRAVKT